MKSFTIGPRKPTGKGSVFETFANNSLMYDDSTKNDSRYVYLNSNKR